jgi:hypothetical protein
MTYCGITYSRLFQQLTLNMRPRISVPSLLLISIYPFVGANISIRLDSHLSTVMMDEITRLLNTYDNSPEAEKIDLVVKRLKAYYYVFDIHSPYAEVRASVSNSDDPTLPVETFRVYFLGILFCFLFSSLNQVSSQLSVSNLCSFSLFDSPRSNSKASVFRFYPFLVAKLWNGGYPHANSECLDIHFP